MTKAFRLSKVEDGYRYLSTPKHAHFARIVVEVEGASTAEHVTMQARAELLASAPVLQARLAEAEHLLRDLTSHYTNAPHCGHDFTCTCKDADIAKARAFLNRSDQ